MSARTRRGFYPLHPSCNKYTCPSQGSTHCIDEGIISRSPPVDEFNSSCANLSSPLQLVAIYHLLHIYTFQALPFKHCQGHKGLAWVKGSKGEKQKSNFFECHFSAQCVNLNQAPLSQIAKPCSYQAMISLLSCTERQHSGSWYQHIPIYSAISKEEAFHRLESKYQDQTKHENACS